MNCGVGRRHGSDPALLWLWRRPAATVPIRPLAWEPPYAAGEALEKATKQNKTKQNKTQRQRAGGWESRALTVCLFVWLFRAAPTTQGGSPARGLIGATVAGLHHSQSDLHHSLWHHWILNPLSEARDQTRNLVVPSQICLRCATTATPALDLFDAYFCDLLGRLWNRAQSGLISALLREAPPRPQEFCLPSRAAGLTQHVSTRRR